MRFMNKYFLRAVRLLCASCLLADTAPAAFAPAARAGSQVRRQIPCLVEAIPPFLLFPRRSMQFSTPRYFAALLESPKVAIPVGIALAAIAWRTFDRAIFTLLPGLPVLTIFLFPVPRRSLALDEAQWNAASGGDVALRHVPHAELEARLEILTARLNEILGPREDYAVLLGDGPEQSERWMYGLAEPALEKLPAFLTYTDAAHLDAMPRWPKTLVLFDDYARTANQVLGLIHRVRRVAPDAEIILAIPYVAWEASIMFQVEPNARWVTDPSGVPVLNFLPRGANLYFDHHIPDHLSLDYRARKFLQKTFGVVTKPYRDVTAEYFSREKEDFARPDPVDPAEELNVADYETRHRHIPSAAEVFKQAARAGELRPRRGERRHTERTEIMPMPREWVENLYGHLVSPARYAQRLYARFSADLFSDVINRLADDPRLMHPWHRMMPPILLRVWDIAEPLQRLHRAHIESIIKTEALTAMARLIAEYFPGQDSFTPTRLQAERIIEALRAPSFVRGVKQTVQGKILRGGWVDISKILADVMKNLTIGLGGLIFIGMLGASAFGILSAEHADSRTRGNRHSRANAERSFSGVRAAA